MTDYCAFSKDHRCIKYADYEITRFELEEADQLCHGNWIEIQHLQDRVDLLERLLKDAGIEIPLE
ncbi:MAG: mobility-associated LCxxNW protein [Lachnospiraceae bacterium]|nr:mobility-associated LCxxNW protein [Lachnospiraceae bacterium]